MEVTDMRGRKKKIEIAETCTKNSKTAFGSYSGGQTYDFDYGCENNILQYNNRITPVFCKQWMKGLPDDPKKVIADPMFVSPGSGKDRLSSLNGYKLKSGSPCFDNSVPVEVEGIIHDFYGNPVVNYPTDIGVYEEDDVN